MRINSHSWEWWLSKLSELPASFPADEKCSSLDLSGMSSSRLLTCYILFKPVNIPSGCLLTAAVKSPRTRMRIIIVKYRWAYWLVFLSLGLKKASQSIMGIIRSTFCVVNQIYHTFRWIIISCLPHVIGSYRPQLYSQQIHQGLPLWDSKTD